MTVNILSTSPSTFLVPNGETAILAAGVTYEGTIINTSFDLFDPDVGSATIEIHGHMISGNWAMSLVVGDTSKNALLNVRIFAGATIVGTGDFGTNLLMENDNNYFRNDGIIDVALVSRGDDYFALNTGTMRRASLVGDSGEFINRGVFTSYAQIQGDDNLFRNIGDFVDGGRAINVLGERNTLINNGNLIGDSVPNPGVSQTTVSIKNASGVSGDGNTFINNGDIDGINAVTFENTFKLVNSGTIEAVTNTIVGYGERADFSEIARIVNRGEISSSDGYAYRSLRLTDDITNRGVINGDISLNEGDDVFNGRKGVHNGTLTAGAGDDIVKGSETTSDVIFGDTGDDSIFGYGGADELHGGSGNDTVMGGSGDDMLFGDSGNDTLHGGSQHDLINGGAGDDILTGGNGADVFVFEAVSDTDTITDFGKGADQIDLSALVGLDFTAVQAASTNTGSDLVIDLDVLGGSGALTLTGVQLVDLSATDFIF